MDNTFYVFEINTKTDNYELSYNTKSYIAAADHKNTVKSYMIAVFKSDGRFYYLRGLRSISNERFEVSDTGRCFVNGLNYVQEAFVDWLKENDFAAFKFLLFNPGLLNGEFSI